MVSRIWLTWTINGHSFWLIQAWVPKLYYSLHHVQGYDALDYTIGFTGRMIGGQDDCYVLEAAPHAEKVNYVLNIYWAAFLIG